MVSTALKDGERIGLKKEKIAVIQEGLTNRIPIPLLAKLTRLRVEDVTQIIEKYCS